MTQTITEPISIVGFYERMQDPGYFRDVIKSFKKSIVKDICSRNENLIYKLNNQIQGGNKMALNTTPKKPEMQDRQRLIVRQSCLERAVSIISDNPKDFDTVDKAIKGATEIAAQFEDWVFRV